MVNTLKAKELQTAPDLPVYTYMNIYCEASCSNLLFVKVRKILLKNIFCTIWELVSWQLAAKCTMLRLTSSNKREGSLYCYSMEIS